MGATNAVKMLSADDNVIRIGGYGVVFGGRDLDGETFTPDTDYQLDLVPRKPVLFDHAQRDIKSALGHVDDVKADDTGLWVEAELERNRDYVEQVMALVQAGALGWSSGTAAHLARREGGVIKSWPVIEWSLTPTPAEPRTLGVDFIKSILDGAGQPVPESINEEQGGDMSEKEVKQEKPVEEPVAQVQAVDLNPVLDAVKSMRAEFSEELAAMKAQMAEVEGKAVNQIKAAPKVISHLTSSSPLKAYLRTGRDEYFADFADSMKAANDTIGNVTTAADGGYAVPTGHFGQIIARRDETMLAPRLGVRRIAGVGLTVNVPVDAEADVEMASTSEQIDDYSNTYTRDFPALGTVAMTLVKYTKKVPLTEELLEDEESNLLSFLADYVGRAQAGQHNTQLVTEVLANGTAGLTLDGASAIAAAEIPELLGKVPTNYADDVKLIMDRGTLFYLRGLSGNPFIFNQLERNGFMAQELGGVPVYEAAAMPDIGGGNKSMVAGNFFYLGLREGGMTMLRDPYTTDGIVYLKYRQRFVYKVLQAEAIQYATHPTA